MGFRMTGVWTRRDIVFPDKQALERAKEFALTKAPITINSYPELKAEYLAIYGQDEAENLAKGNLVQSNQQRYVQERHMAPPDPKPPEPEPGPDAGGGQHALRDDRQEEAHRAADGRDEAVRHHLGRVPRGADRGHDAVPEGDLPGEVLRHWPGARCSPVER